MKVVRREEVSAFTTKDGSEIRELLAPRNSELRNLSLAEARVEPGGETAEHFHKSSDEIYYILEGEGIMRIEGEERKVRPGDAIAIPAGRKHKIKNDGDRDLIFLCFCAPSYTHEDTIITAPQGRSSQRSS